MRYQLRITLGRIAETAATSGLHFVCVTTFQPHIEDLCVGVIRVPLTVFPDTVASSFSATLQPPRLAVDAVDPCRNRKRRQRLYDHLRAQATAMTPGSGAVFTDAVALDEHRIFALQLLGGAVVSIAVVNAHGDGNAVLRGFGAPATAKRANADDEQPSILR